MTGKISHQTQNVTAHTVRRTEPKQNPWRNIVCCNTQGSSPATIAAAGLWESCRTSGGCVPEASLERAQRVCAFARVCPSPQLPDYSLSPRIWNKVTVPGRPRVKATLSHLPFNSPPFLTSTLRLIQRFFIAFSFTFSSLKSKFWTPVLKSSSQNRFGCGTVESVSSFAYDKIRRNVLQIALKTTEEE